MLARDDQECRDLFDSRLQKKNKRKEMSNRAQGRYGADVLSPSHDPKQAAVVVGPADQI
jgi:hypothetical protein